MSFKDIVASDIRGVFLNSEEFADLRTVIYDGETYSDIPVVISNVKEKDRTQNGWQSDSDHVQGLYRAVYRFHAALDDLGGVLPEHGMRIQVNDREGGGGFFRGFYITTSGVEMGMVCLELEAIDE